MTEAELIKSKLKRPSNIQEFEEWIASFINGQVIETSKPMEDMTIITHIFFDGSKLRSIQYKDEFLIDCDSSFPKSCIEIRKPLLEPRSNSNEMKFKYGDAEGGMAKLTNLELALFAKDLDDMQNKIMKYLKDNK